MHNHTAQPRIAIVGGGLAGLAAAAALCVREQQVTLFEARRQLGGRAGSFHDNAYDRSVDHCQHVGMGCCTNLQHFCRQTGVAQFFQRHGTLYFFGPDNRCYPLNAASGPAPLHLLPWLLRLGYLSWTERLSVARALLKLAREPAQDTADTPTIGQWLRKQGQSERAIDRFWTIVLVSALGESLERASLAAARKVMVDGFMVHRDAYQVDIPRVPLSELYDQRVAQWLVERGVQLRLGSPIKQILADADAAHGVVTGDGVRHAFDYVVLATPWRRAASLLPAGMSGIAEQLAEAGRFHAAPITALHLWFDRPLTDLPHAVLIDRLSQWVFNRGSTSTSGFGGAPADRPETHDDSASWYYYQVVISASHDLAGRDRDEVCREVLEELAEVWPAGAAAQLKHWRMVTEQQAVFSVRPGLEQLRPPQQTSVPNLMLAGDWTRTGWPATMEGAVRSGYLAAEAVLAAQGRPEPLLAADLPRSWLSRLLVW